MSFDPKSLLDLPPFPADGYAKLADRLAAILRTRNDVLLVQGEAIVALEAAATSIASPAIHALNIVTSPYGRMFGDWLRRGGAQVRDVVARAGLPVEAGDVGEGLAAHPRTNLVALVHAESATGILNPLPEIAALAKARGALLVVDAVASVGGHALDVDALGIDVCAIGPQKSLGGPAGVSALSVSGAAWRAVEHADAPAASILSLMDHRRLWLDTGRSALPGMPSALEWHALAAALDRFQAGGVDAAVARHAKAAAAARAGLPQLGAELWIADPAKASNLVTAAKLPGGVEQAAFLEAVGPASGIDAAVGVAGLVRLNHTGERARLEPVLESLRAFGLALAKRGVPADLAAAEQAARAAFGR
jgi:aspartate aminotransferase-like enzyme